MDQQAELPTRAHARTSDTRPDGVEVVVFEGPLPRLGDDPLTQGEERFREALEGAGQPASRFSRWAAKARADWHQRTGTPMREGE